MVNLYRWTAKGYLIKLRNGCYAFSESVRNEDYSFFLSQFIYRPSYISLETALAFYGVIPEAVVDITAVTTQKTQSFSNEAGHFSYRTISPKFFWGYKKHLMGATNQAYYIADLEKAILDYLYLNTFYNQVEDMAELRFDDYVMEEVVDREKLRHYTERFNIATLSERIQLLLSLYE